MYFNVNFNVLFKSIKVHLLVSEHYIYQNARCNDKKKTSRFRLPQNLVLRKIFQPTGHEVIGK